ncbi:hypothetical protein GQ44DRAFT_832603 [Phaeosphaeriaceae sp. PMI808]|nr:hypothetical protein GQ44DRAFT_832603 [Phaeosphaeriaceae sp. PMI808]
MDPFSVAAGAVGFANAAARLAESCVKVYEFWKALQEAPGDLMVIQNDLQSITGVLKKLSGIKLDSEVAAILNLCQMKIQELAEIIGQFDIDSGLVAPKRQKLRMKYRMMTKIKQVEKLQRVFRDVRDNLMLGLMIQSVHQPALSFTNQEFHIAQIRVAANTNNPADPDVQLRNPILTKTTGYPTNPTPMDELPNKQSPDNINRPKKLTPPLTASLKSEDSSLASIAASAVIQKFLQHTMHLAVDDLIASGTVQQLLESSLNHVTSFDTTYYGSYTSEECAIRRSPLREDTPMSPKPSGVPHDTTRQGPRLSRARMCHQKSSIGVVLGSIWIRTSTLKVAEKSSLTGGQLELINSFIFYPCAWLQRFGMRYGTEASLQWSPTVGWKFNVSAIRAIPENSLIFDMSRRGNVDGVQLLLERNEASIKDTSPKGWTPLHFAASGGHVELCRTLIDLGADKQALAYEGPTAEALSPLTIWSELCRTVSASKKIDMMRVFGSECLDVTELNGDGWIVGHNLIASMSQEQCNMSETAVNYLYTLKQNEILVALGANSVWHGLQQAIRGFLIEEHEHGVIGKLLSVELGKGHGGYQSQVRAIGHWIALRASQRDLIPIAIQAAQVLQVDGYDAFPGAEGMSKRDLNRTLPLLYSTWAKMSARVLANVREMVEAEFNIVLGELSMDPDALGRRLGLKLAVEPEKLERETKLKCDACKDDYSTLGKGLVQPGWIAFEECRVTRHRYHCACIEYLHARGIAQEIQVPISGDPDEDIEEEICKEPDVDLDQLCKELDGLGVDSNPHRDPFYNATMMLYQAQGRRWIGKYGPLETLCAACFLEREKYLGKEGPSGDNMYTPAPTSFVSAVPADTFSATYTT